MKRKLAIVSMAIVAYVALLVYGCQAADGSWINGVTLAPVGALRTAGITGSSEWGAGIDLGAKVNPFVSLHVVNLSFEGNGDSTTIKTEHGSATRESDAWGGRLVDETDILVKAKIARFSTESFSLYGIGGGVRDWNGERWGVSVGAGMELAFNKHLSLGADYSVRPYFKAVNGSSKDSLLRALVNITF